MPLGAQTLDRKAAELTSPEKVTAPIEGMLCPKRSMGKTVTTAALDFTSFAWGT